MIFIEAFYTFNLLKKYLYIFLLTRKPYNVINFKFAYSKHFSTKCFESVLFESPKNVISIDCHPAIIEVKQIGNRTNIVV